jgi:hypothetical protein
VRVRYGAMGIKRMDLEVGTNSEGKAVIKELPDKARPMTYDEGWQEGCRRPGRCENLRGHPRRDLALNLRSAGFAVAR